MYIPSAFRVEDAEKLASFMEQHRFATLVTHDGAAPFASHLPMLLRKEGGPHGTLVSHMARANPQWRHFTNGQEALAVFHGPHAYISPLMVSNPARRPDVELCYGTRLWRATFAGRPRLRYDTAARNGCHI